MNLAQHTQAAKDRQYEQAYGEWLSSLTFEQKQKLTKLGLAKAECSYIGNGRTHDISELPLASLDTTLMEEETHDKTIEIAAGELLKEFLYRIIEDKDNPRLEAECISLAFGFGAARGQTQTQVAKQYGVTRATVSKRVREIKRAYHLPTSEYMKSESACDTYKLTNRTRA